MALQEVNCGNSDLGNPTLTWCAGRFLYSNTNIDESWYKWVELKSYIS